MSKEQKQLTENTVEEVTALVKSGNFSLDAYFGQTSDEGFDDDLWAAMEGIDDLEGVMPRLPQIDIAHQVQMFKLPDETKAERIKGIVVDTNRCNAYWKKRKKSTEDNSKDNTGDGAKAGTPPDCFSTDSVKPSESSSEKQATLCSICKHNQFGSGENGKGCACKNMRRVHLLIPGSSMPHRLTLPPTNLIPWDVFVAEQVTSKKLKLMAILVEIGLAVKKNDNGYDSSVIVPSVVKDELGKPVKIVATKAQIDEILKFRESWLSAMRGQEILSDEHIPQTSDEGDSDKYEVYDVPTHAGPVKETQDPVEDAPPFDDDDQDDLF